LLFCRLLLFFFLALDPTARPAPSKRGSTVTATVTLKPRTSLREMVVCECIRVCVPCVWVS
jgi:hypothetical protein